MQNYNYHDLKKYNLLFPPCDYCVFGCCLHSSGVGPIWTTIFGPPLPDRFDSPHSFHSWTRQETVISPAMYWMILHVLFCPKVNTAETPPRRDTLNHHRSHHNDVFLLPPTNFLLKVKFRFAYKLIALPATSSFAPNFLTEQNTTYQRWTHNHKRQSWPVSKRAANWRSDCWIKQHI